MTNISYFENYKTKYHLSKPRSYLSILVVEEKDDDWFIRIIYHYTKSGKITDSSIIIQSDLESRLNHLLRDGWKITKI